MRNAQSASPSAVDVEKAPLIKRCNDSMIMMNNEQRTMARNTLIRMIMKVLDA